MDYLLLCYFQWFFRFEGFLKSQIKFSKKGNGAIVCSNYFILLLP